MILLKGAIRSSGILPVLLKQDFVELTCCQADSCRVVVGIHYGKEVPSLVSIAEEAKHIALRKSISLAFTPSGVLDYDVFVDQGIDELLNVLEREPTIDFALWMLLYSMDVSSRMLFGEPLGFLESESDVGRDYTSHP
jgi:cytochrome P450